jgi:hypothetical protein
MAKRSLLSERPSYVHLLVWITKSTQCTAQYVQQNIFCKLQEVLEVLTTLLYSVNHLPL